MEYMASDTLKLRTSSSSLKRSLDHGVVPSELPSRRRCGYHAERRTVSVSSIPSVHSIHPHTKRRTHSASIGSTMLVQSLATMSASYPPFRSVYENSPTASYDNAASPEELYQNKGSDHSFTHCSSHILTQSHAPPEPRSRIIHRRSSVNSAVSTSTESSPSTTISTFDSPLLAEASDSPSSSPESASSAAPLKSFQAPTRLTESQTDMLFKQQPEVSSSTMFSSSSSPPPSGETGRNVRNLTLDMNMPALAGTDQTTGFDGHAHPFSAPTSPLRDGLKTGRRKPNNLTIRTPGFSELTFGKVPNLVPPTPGRKLSHPLSSPCLSSLVSPTKGPPGGMRLALPSLAQHRKHDSDASNSGSSIGGSLPSLREEEYQPPKSQEVAERGYAAGPVLIYDSGIYLYLEPTAEEASRFDTIINVAREIKNPFESAEAQHDTVMSVWRNNSADRKSVIEPQTATSEKSFKSAFEWPVASGASIPASSSTQTIPAMPTKRPEYLHVRWDHNSEILDDLYPLCQLIDDRVTEGKKVLIHCQLGVSRSASLVIAYGLFKGFKNDFHSMYMTVKQRSQWVGPNMSLIYQLTDFRSRCVKGEYANGGRAADPHWFISDAEGTKTPAAAPKTSNNQGVEPDTHNVPGESPSVERSALRLNKDLPLVSPFQNQGRPIRPTLGASRSSSIQHPVPFQPFISPALPTPAASRPLPLRIKPQLAAQINIPPHRPTAMPGLTLAQPGSLMDLAVQDVPSSPSLFSPRATEFSATPFGITTAGDLVTSTPKRMRPPPGAFPGGKEWRQSLRQSMDLTGDFSKILAYDPRSPPQVGEARDFLRNIDDVL